MDIDILLELPYNVSCYILGSWVNMRDLVDVDNAYCNKAKRKDFLNLISSHEYVQDVKEEYEDWDFNHDFSWQWGLERELKISRIEVNTHGLSKELLHLIVSYIAKLGKGVRELIVDHDGVGCGIIDAAVDRCRKLTDICVSSVRNIYSFPRLMTLLHVNASTLRRFFFTVGHAYCFDVEECIKLKWNFPVLSELYLYSTLSFDGAEEMSNIVDLIAPCAPNLTEVCLYPVFFTKEGCAALDRHCTKLERVRLNDACAADFDTIIRNQPSRVLLSVDLHSGNSTQLTHFFKHLRGICCLKFGYHHACSDSLLHTLATYHHTTLTELIVGENYDPDQQYNGIQEIARKCSHITSLGFNCILIPAKVIVGWLRLFPHLKKLDLLDSMPSDGILAAIGKNLHDLQELFLFIGDEDTSNPIEFSEKGLEAVALGCKDLKVLQLGDASKIMSHFCLRLWCELRPNLSIY